MYPTNQQITCRLHDLPLSIQSERSERVQQTQVVVRAKRAQLLVTNEYCILDMWLGSCSVRTIRTHQLVELQLNDKITLLFLQCMPLSATVLCPPTTASEIAGKKAVFAIAFKTLKHNCHASIVPYVSLSTCKHYTPCPIRQ